MKKLENKRKSLYFFIGTEAELIKLFPVLQECNKNKIPYRIIASGQNNITQSILLKYILPKKIDIVLSDTEITQTPLGLFSWFVKTLIKGVYMPRKELQNNKGIFVIHGDTVSTVMGSLIGRFYGFKIVHIEAGLRSFDFFHPFPEELDRIIASYFANIFFCPNDWAVKNLSKKKGKKINTLQNTLYDSLQFILRQKTSFPLGQKLGKAKYFVFITHRQENVFNRTRMAEFLEEIEKISKSIKGVFVLHTLTKSQLKEWGLLRRIQNNKNIMLVDRLSYGAFMKLLKNCEFIITDGGSNQEESYYLGKPCLILRSVTERIEGLGHNVILSNYESQAIVNFLKNYKKFQRKPITVKTRPSAIIVKFFSEQK